jgi:tetratricopeptide (TPR) repeat protein
VRLDVEKEGKTLGKKYNITNYPTILFVDARGNDMGRIDGYEPPEEFRKHAETFQKDFVREPALRSKYKSSPKNIDTVVALGVIEANRYNTSAALKKLSEAEKIDAGNRSGKITELYSAVADIYQNAASYDHAISYFKKAAGTAKKTTPKAYALLSIATCYLSKEGPLDPNAASDLDRRREHIIANCKLALPYLNETLKLPNLSAEDKEIAESNIAQIKSILSDVDGE